MANKGYENLFKYIDIFENDTNYGNWVFEDGHKGTEDDPFIMPYATLSKDISQFIEEFYKSTLFDNNYVENRDKLDNSKSIGELNESELSTMLTNIIRGDRFCEGLILSKMQDGTITKILKRLKQINNEHDDCK